jgi:amino acid transporter
MSQENQTNLSLFLAIILGINTVIGSGVFTMPLQLFKAAGPSGILSVIFASICVLMIGICFARIAYLEPEGGFYSYVSAWGGKFTGVLASFSYLTGLTIALGLLAKIASGYISFYMIGVDVKYIGYFITVCSFIATLFASSVGRFVQILLFILTIIPLFAISFLCFKTFNINNFNPFITNGSYGIISAVPVVLFSFLGFEAISSMGRKVSNPTRNIPIATLLVIFISAIIYIFFVGSIIGAINKDLLLTKNTLAEVLLYSFNNLNWIVHFINISIIITIIGTVYSLMISLSELLNQTLKKASNDKISISETLSILLISIFMTLSMNLFTNIGKTFSYVCIFVVLAYLLTNIYLLISPRKNSDRILGLFGSIASGIMMIAAILQII